jgi:hypothetical protein
MKARTDAYVMTADVNSVNDMAAIEIVRKTVRTSNKLAMESYKWVCKRAEYHGEPKPRKPMLYRVCLKGRLGKGNPAAAKYKGRYHYHVALADATRIDVYVHQRSE